MPSATTESSSSTPIKRKSNLKKHQQQQSSHTASSAENTPLRDSRSSNIMNDDAAEKAHRRKSAHFGEARHPDGTKKDATGRRVVSALAVQAQQQQAAAASAAAGGNGSSGMAAKKAKRLSAVAPAAPVISMEVMNTNFEEWMKLATDNKITANNTWNFALIDYFADLTLLRNDEDQSINFQKASCTLDGCVKIWTSRVDSVATETGKLLSGLAGGGGGDEADEEGEDGEEDEEGGETRKTRKTTHRSEATLAKSFATLQVKKFDLEFSVDPLFKKTCADFDEGGAMGLLMNHLSLDGKGRVVFDAGDAGVDEEDEDEEQEEDELIDLTKLRAYMPSMEKTMGLEISDTLSSFRFSSDPNNIPDFATLVGLRDNYGDDGPSNTHDDYVPTGEAQDFFGDENFDVGVGGGFDDGASAGGYDDEQGGYGEAAAGYSGAGGVGMAAPGDVFAPFDPRRQGGELVMALVGGGEEEGMFDYFDKGFGKSWAGAEHWKLRKVSRKDPAAASTTRAIKAVKAPFTIDFASPAEASTSSKVLFAPAPKATLMLPSSSKSKRTSKKSAGADSRKRKDEWLLPDDMHFSSRQLLRLFLKPKYALRMRKNVASRITENANGEIDENFWAQAAADRADFANGEGDEGVDGAPNPFESQFFHDDADDAFVDDHLGFDGDGGMGLDGGDEDDLWQGTQGQELKKSRPENVNFAKKAKRVDVKRLKDDIWSGLRTLVPVEPAPRSESEDEAPVPSTPIEPVKTFDSVIQNLRTTYPTEKMSEISTSFCFICLLHLANEEGLRIETARYDGLDEEDVGCMGEANLEADEDDPALKWRGIRMDKGERQDRVVGELQALKVFKDPNAGRAA